MCTRTKKICVHSLRRYGHIHLEECVHSRTHSRAHTHAHANADADAATRTRTHTDTGTQTRTHKQTHTHTCTRARAYTRTHTHTQVNGAYVPRIEAEYPEAHDVAVITYYPTIKGLERWFLFVCLQMLVYVYKPAHARVHIRVLVPVPAPYGMCVY